LPLFLLSLLGRYPDCIASASDSSSQVMKRTRLVALWMLFQLLKPGIEVLLPLVLVLLVSPPKVRVESLGQLFFTRCNVIHQGRTTNATYHPTGRTGSQRSAARKAITGVAYAAAILAYITPFDMAAKCGAIS